MKDCINKCIDALSVLDIAKFVVAEFRQAQADIAEQKMATIIACFELAYIMNDKYEGLVDLMGRTL